MPAHAVLGAQWGDEGKGKIVDFLAEDADIVARFSGGNNAGHTVINDLGEFSLHLLPCGVFNENVTNIIGNGLVINPDILISEINALNDVMTSEKKILLVTQKNSETDDPKRNDIFNYGCESRILQLLKLPDGTVKVLVEGVKRVKILDFLENEKFIKCDYEVQKDEVNKDEDLISLSSVALRRLEKLTTINKKIPTDTLNNIKDLKDPSSIADHIASHLNMTISEKQQIFETFNVKKRLDAVIKVMENETSIIGVEKRIRGRVKNQMEKTQREYYLNEQLKAIQKELGEIEDGKDESTNLKKSILYAKMP